jgi:hypothetical protein
MQGYSLTPSLKGGACAHNWVTPRIPEIPSPYAFSPSHTVYQDGQDRLVIVVETAHKRYDVFDVSAGFP